MSARGLGSGATRYGNAVEAGLAAASTPSLMAGEDAHAVAAAAALVADGEPDVPGQLGDDAVRETEPGLDVPGVHIR
jgi:hypothetical protein